MGLLDVLAKGLAAPVQVAEMIRAPIRDARTKATVNLEKQLRQIASAQATADLTQQQARTAAALRGSGTGGVLSQFGPDTAKQLGTLINSEVPELRQLGSGLLGQLMGAKFGKGTFDQRMLTPQQRTSLAQDESQFIRTQEQNQKQFQASFGLDKLRTDAYLRSQQEQAAAARASITAVPPAVMSQVTEQTIRLTNLNQGIEGAETLANIWEQFGLVDAKRQPELAGQAQLAVMKVFPLLQAKFNSGTLNEGELEFYQELAKDPSSIVTRIMARDQAVISMMRGLAADGRQQRDAMKLTPLAGYLNPGLFADNPSLYAPPPNTIAIDMPTAPEGPGIGQRLLGPAGLNALGQVGDFLTRQPMGR